MTEEALEAEFEELLDYLKRVRGFDFGGYKRASLVRRVQKRMEGVGIESFADYIDYLEVHQDEFAQLFNTILINVTGFFRDAPAWHYLSGEAIPSLLARKQPGQPIRVWSAGCASGEEAYTLAMVLAEALGLDAFRDRVKIYATDMDEEALNYARQASYTAKEIAGVAPDLLTRYFEPTDGRYAFRKDLRRSVIFGRHDLIQDAPISRVDLLTCRNVLMYFNAETQSRILARFHFGLEPGGLLLLGRAEMLFTHSNMFAPVDLRRRLFVALPRANMRDRLFTMGTNGDLQTGSASHTRLRELAWDASPLAQIVVDQRGVLVAASNRARAAFGLTPKDLGRPLQDLEVSSRPLELRACIEQAYMDRDPVVVKEVETAGPAGERRWLDIQVASLTNSAGAALGVVVTFTDVTRHRRLQEELEHSHQELETAYEELQSSNEELETTNEELQSTVEELETTNEELQSTNEELETMNEELQSTNEELQTINDELRLRSDELNELNAHQDAILGSLVSAVVVLDTQLSVQVWNRRAEDLWGLRADEVVNRNFLDLDIGLPVGRLRPAIRACAAGESDREEVALRAVNRRGRPILCRVGCCPLVGYAGDIRGVILLMEADVTAVPVRDGVDGSGADLGVEAAP